MPAAMHARDDTHSDPGRPHQDVPHDGTSLVIEGVGHRYAPLSPKEQPIEALRDIRLEVRAGEFLSLIGPSGCGKSTLLRVVAGLVEPTEGSIRFQSAGRTFGALEGGQVGFVFQDSVLLPWKTVWQNVLFPLQVLHRLTPTAEARAADLLKVAGLESFRDSLPKQLSGGMRQRVSIVRALAHDPQILLMDEPFGALDALTRDRLNLELLRIWEERRKTILFVTHSIEEAVFLSDRVAVLSERPARLVDVINVNLPRPRAPGLRDSPEFRQLVSRLRGLLG